MPRRLTEYNLLFSCPGDAYKECYTVIKTAVDDFNKYAKSSLSLGVNLTHWTTDSYPQSGGHPQTLLNDQIVDSADAAVAIFWTRFGTPTDEYDSGTEEEIERLINSNKQVFLYFLDKAIPPSATDSDTYQEQRKQIAAFREKYENKGLYWVVADAAALKEQFSQHLFLYFAKQVAEETGASTGNEKSALTVTAVDGTPEARIQNLNLSVKMAMETRKRSIIEKIKIIQDIVIPQETKAEEESALEPSAISESYSKLITNLSSSAKITELLSSKKKATVTENDRSVVAEFCKTNKIAPLDKDFWNLGELQIEISQTFNVMGGGRNKSLVGTDIEKKKYELIRELVSDTYQYTDSDAYYRKMDSLPYIELIIRNDGTTFDEDIEISLTLPHNSLMRAENFPVPLFELEDIVDNASIDTWICPLVTASIGEFDYSPSYGSNFTPRIPTMGLPFQKRDYEAEYEQKKKDYYNRINELLDWEVFVQDTTDTVKMQIRKLNQFRSMHLPARLFLNTVPDKIGYSITAKYSPSIIKGEVTIR